MGRWVSFSRSCSCLFVSVVVFHFLVISRLVRDVLLIVYLLIHTVVDRELFNTAVQHKDYRSCTVVCTTVAQSSIIL